MKNYLNYLAFILLIVIAFTSGFFVGFKNKEASIEPSSKVSLDTKSSSSSDISSSLSILTSSEVQGQVFWIKVGTEPVCPSGFDIKGKFDSSSAKFYYMRSNKSYDRVKPDICFKSEEFARDTAGFVKKF